MVKDVLGEAQRIVSSICPANSAKKNKNPCKFSLETILGNNPAVNPRLVRAIAVVVVVVDTLKSLFASLEK